MAGVIEKVPGMLYYAATHGRRKLSGFPKQYAMSMQGTHATRYGSACASIDMTVEKQSGESPS